MRHMRFVLGALGAAFLIPASAGAYHAGCVAHTAAPECEYTAIGSHSCAGYTDSTYEASVMREVWDEELEEYVLVRVVLASGDGTAVTDSVNALPNELVTLTLLDDGSGGLISCGNTAGHP